MLNTGVPSEKLFEAMLQRKYGKKAFVYKIEDQKAATGLNKKFTLANPRPADYVITCDGLMAFAEIKSTSAPRFKKAMLRTNQIAAMVRQTAAGGQFLVFAHYIPKNEWYMLPGKFFLEAQCKSWTWDELKQFYIEDAND